MRPPDGPMSLKSQALKRISERKEVFKQLVIGVSHLHAHHICHLDLSVENVCACRDPTRHNLLSVKIIDFGVAQSFKTESFGTAALVTTSAPPGKIPCMAPELLSSLNRELREVFDGPAADMWSVGILLFQLLSPRASLWQSAAPSDIKFRALLDSLDMKSLAPLSSLVPELGQLSATALHSASSLALRLLHPKSKQRMKHEELKDVVYGLEDTPWVDEPEATGGGLEPTTLSDESPGDGAHRILASLHHAIDNVSAIEESRLNVSVLVREFNDVARLAIPESETKGRPLLEDFFPELVRKPSFSSLRLDVKLDGNVISLITDGDAKDKYYASQAPLSLYMWHVKKYPDCSGLKLDPYAEHAHMQNYEKICFLPLQGESDGEWMKAAMEKAALKKAAGERAAAEEAAAAPDWKAAFVDTSTLKEDGKKLNVAAGAIADQAINLV